MGRPYSEKERREFFRQLEAEPASFAELKRRKMEMHGLQDEAELLAFEAIGDILHRQWLYESVAPGYGDRRMAVKHLGDVIRRAMNAAADRVLNESGPG